MLPFTSLWGGGGGGGGGVVSDDEHMLSWKKAFEPIGEFLGISSMGLYMRRECLCFLNFYIINTVASDCDFFHLLSYVNDDFLIYLHVPEYVVNLFDTYARSIQMELHDDCRTAVTGCHTCWAPAKSENFRFSFWKHVTKLLTTTWYFEFAQMDICLLKDLYCPVFFSEGLD